jgi:hypothetical protein
MQTTEVKIFQSLIGLISIVFIALIGFTFVVFFPEYRVNTDICNKTVHNWEGWKAPENGITKKRIIRLNGDFDWIKFDNYVKELFGESLSENGSLVVIKKNQTIIFEIDDKARIDLNEKGRFIHNLGGNCIMRGGSLTISNGIADNQNEESGGAIRQVEGSIDLFGISLIVENSKAYFGGGIYLMDGFFQLKDDNEFPSTLLIRNCETTKNAGGGLSIWEAKVTIQSDYGWIECENCTSYSHGGGVILFYGEISLVGQYSMLIARECKATDQQDSQSSYGAGIQAGELYNPSGADDTDCIIKLKGSHSVIKAIKCEASSAVGMSFYNATICLNGPSPILTATDNTITDTSQNTRRQRCIIDFYNCSLKSNWPLSVYIKDNNICSTPNECNDVKVHYKLDEPFAINVTGEGTIRSYDEYNFRNAIDL